jgi:hypothetical protein
LTSTISIPRLELVEHRQAIWSICAAVFVSTAGSNLLLIAMSSHYYLDKSDALGAGLIYAAQYVSVVLLSPVALRLSEAFLPRRVLFWAEVAGAGMSLLAAWALNSVFAVALCLLVGRGFLELLVKTSRGVAVKIVGSEVGVEWANNRVNGAYFLGSAAGGLIGVVALNSMSILGVALVNMATFIISALLYARLPAWSQDRKSGLQNNVFRSTLRLMQDDVTVRKPLVLLLLLVILFQGINQVGRVWIPIQWLGLGLDGPALLEVFSVAGIVTGLVLVGVFFSGDKRKRLPIELAVLGCAAASYLPFLSKALPWVMFAYWLYMVLFEVAFMRALNTIFLVASKEDIALVLTFFYTTAFAGTALTVMIVGALLNCMSLASVMSVAIACSCVVVLINLRR